MNRQRGFSTLAMVMLLLVLGGVLLQGLDQHLRAQSPLIINEREAIAAFNRALSAQAWGTTIDWQPTNRWQCQTKQQVGWRVCVKSLPKKDVLMAAQGTQDNQPITLWRWGRQGVSVTFSAHGWIDICPLHERALCKLP